MNLKNLLNEYQINSKDIEITGISSDSRTIQKGNLFLAYPGEESDGRKYIDKAIANGAGAVLTEKQDYIEKEFDVPVMKVDKLKSLAGEIAAKYYNYPTKDIKIIGVTGTNGKTSTCFYIAELLNMLNIKSAVIGTTGYGLPDKLQEISNTTPGPIELQKIFFELKNIGVKVVAMEVSSHALVQGRVLDVEIDAAVFTNLSQDHLDYHKDMEDYANAKKMIFFMPHIKNIVLNIDDAFGKKWFKEFSATKRRLLGYSCKIEENAENIIFVDNLDLSMNGLSFDIKYNNNSFSVKTELLGHFNISNILASVSVLTELGYDFKDIVKSCEQLKAVPGRMQVVKPANKELPIAVVDYAHTPDALINALSALKKQCAGKLICVFGCGGNRDRKKRPLMAQAVEKYADLIVITNDNPRYEDQYEIIEDIKTGINDFNNVLVEADRRKAIELAISKGKGDDIVLIAGKGHEDYQIVNGVKNHFSDVETVENYLNAFAS